MNPQHTLERRWQDLAFDTEKAIEKGFQALGTTGPAAALGMVIGYGLPGSVKELRGQEQVIAAASTTLISIALNIVRNWWKHRRK